MQRFVRDRSNFVKISTQRMVKVVIVTKAKVDTVKSPVVCN